MPILEVTAPITTARPTLVLAITGWVDAGLAATTAGENLTETGRVVATFASDEIYDYRSNRPALDFEDGTAAGVVWPELSLTAVTLDGEELLVVSGTEPNLRWRTIARELAGVASTVGVRRVISIGAVPAAVAHTLAPPVMVTSSDPSVEPPVMPLSRFSVPGALVNVLAHTVAERTGAVDTGYWAQIPHYVSGVYWAGAKTLVEKTAAVLGVSIDTAGLERKAEDQRIRLDEATQQNAAAQQYVRRLENAAPGSVTPFAGEELSAEVEDFLRSLGDDGPSD